MLPRRNRIVPVLIFIGILLIAVAGHANRIGGDAYPFLKVGVGARALGMGGAFVSLADDATAPYWNPAGLGLQTQSRQVSYMGALVGDDEFGRQHTFLSLLYPELPVPLLGINGTWALSWINMGIEDIPQTGADQFGELLRIGSFNDSQSAFFLSFGRGFFTPPGQLLPILYLGSSIRYIRHSLDGLQGAKGSGSGWGIDLGLISDINTVFSRQNEAFLRFFYNVKVGEQLGYRYEVTKVID